MRYVLLSMQPLLTPGTFTCEAHVELIESTLEMYGRDLSSVSYVVVADVIGCPMIGMSQSEK